MQSFNPLNDSPKFIESLFTVSEKNCTLKPETLSFFLNPAEKLKNALVNLNPKESMKIAKSIMEELSKHEKHEVKQLVQWIVKNTHNKLGEEFDGAYQSLHHLFGAIKNLPETPKVEEHILNLYHSANHLNDIESMSLVCLKEKFRNHIDSLSDIITAEVVSRLDKHSLLNLSLTSKFQYNKIKSLIPKLLNSGKVTLKSLDMSLEELRKFIGKKNCLKIWNLNLGSNIKSEELTENDMRYFPNIVKFSLIDCKNIKYINFKCLSNIEDIIISNCEKYEELSVYSKKLKEITVCNCKNLREIYIESKGNANLTIDSCETFSSFGVCKSKNLNKININNCDRFNELSFIHHEIKEQYNWNFHTKINNLIFINCDKIKNFNYQNWTDLLSLRLHCCSIKDLNFLKFCPKIEEFDISNCKIVDFSGLENLKNLRSLNCSFSKVDSLEFLKLCPHIKKLNLLCCEIENSEIIKDCKTFEDFKNVLGLPNLEEVEGWYP